MSGEKKLNSVAGRHLAARKIQRLAVERLRHQVLGAPERAVRRALQLNHRALLQLRLDARQVRCQLGVVLVHRERRLQDWGHRCLVHQFRRLDTPEASFINQALAAPADRTRVARAVANATENSQRLESERTL